jgi:putative oxidoreductase
VIGRYPSKEGCRNTPLEVSVRARISYDRVRGVILQRLFSTFPDRWPGFGLLLMRLSLGTTLIYLGATENMIEAAAGVFVIAGLWTPVTATVAALDQIWMASSLSSSEKSAVLMHVLLGTLCVSVAMLGPGAWSVDARLYGRRRFPPR